MRRGYQAGEQCKTRTYCKTSISVIPACDQTQQWNSTENPEDPYTALQ